MPWGFRRRRDASAYEKELTRLAAKISNRQQKQLRYSIQGRRAKLFVTLYSILLYAAYSGLVLFGYRQRSPVNLSALLTIPFGIWAVRWALTRWYGWLSRTNDESLKALLAQRHEMVEELKQKTNFYSTQALLDRFDPDSKPSKSDKTEKNEKLGKQEFKSNASVQSSGQKPGQTTKQGQASPGQTPGLQHPQVPLPQGINPQSARILKSTQVAYVPKWYDRILDLIVGEDEYSSRQRYALICRNCKVHNGLAQPGEAPEDVVYICPHCGTLNGRPKETTHPEKESEKEISRSSESVSPEPQTKEKAASEERPSSSPSVDSD
uniref:Endoplasmic reticulum junction formation protein lunapark n=1 Tax=Blastobotrys adeninivorans TaxID=409370 RepID=A0A060THQ6_BLAAD